MQRGGGCLRICLGRSFGLANRRSVGTTYRGAPRNLYSEQQKLRNRSAANYVLSVVIGFFGLSYAAVPLYRALCQRTGWGGVPVTDSARFTSDKLIPVEGARRIKVTFSGQCSDVMPWKFRPEQKEVKVLPGETALAFYKAKNTSDKDIIGMATYSVTPGSVAPYFSKIQCFCFEEQKLRAGEEVDMPVFFFIDPEFAYDPAMRSVDNIILHYTFFKAHYDDNGQLVPVSS